MKDSIPKTAAERPLTAATLSVYWRWADRDRTRHSTTFGLMSPLHLPVSATLGIYKLKSAADAALSLQNRSRALQFERFKFRPVMAELIPGESYAEWHLCDHTLFLGIDWNP
jgi:hypothetical protein